MLLLAPVPEGVPGLTSPWFELSDAALLLADPFIPDAVKNGESIFSCGDFGEVGFGDCRGVDVGEDGTNFGCSGWTPMEGRSFTHTGAILCVIGSVGDESASRRTTRARSIIWEKRKIFDGLLVEKKSYYFTDISTNVFQNLPV